ncbi:hypothetical protein SPV1_09178 [Mariprofundus ferrooxydans PV-1]|uniref:Uncharacterized protein n=1 Tax=Mariprofundus ferrooxydans PV-1 TaxID=314345 RepID=Q0F029_9PROT|nr:hypothetical protein SPV1_09178 [Mariprofundus ferrooxydans PV-1]
MQRGDAMHTNYRCISTQALAREQLAGDTAIFQPCGQPAAAIVAATGAMAYANNPRFN